MMDVQLKKLENTKENVDLVSTLMAKDVSGKCFTNRDLDGNIVSYSEIAEVFLEYAELYVITAFEMEIGLFMISNGNEIGIFVEPDFQKNGIASKILQLVKEKLMLKEAIAEISTDNEVAIKFFQKNGFIETGEKRTVTIDGKDVLVKKYVNLNF